MNIDNFQKNDWDHMHDVVLSVIHKSCTMRELIEFYKSLPEDLHELAEEWGMNDTVFRENAYEFLREKENARIISKLDADEARNKKFSAWIVKMIGEGRIWFSVRPNVVGEKEADELDVVVEFAGGPERIGNDGSGSYSWRELESIAEAQGLLK